ncbi:hypothetical protein [Mycolicibacterium llatzerense]|uniref:hypothetical protein n=1 Tax=Mycolicibacterium llatzerense TaxID=280871 RepID=UPI0036700974
MAAIDWWGAGSTERGGEIPELNRRGDLPVIVEARDVWPPELVPRFNQYADRAA